MKEPPARAPLSITKRDLARSDGRGQCRSGRRAETILPAFRRTGYPSKCKRPVSGCRVLLLQRNDRSGRALNAGHDPLNRYVTRTEPCGKAWNVEQKQPRLRDAGGGQPFPALTGHVEGKAT